MRKHKSPKLVHALRLRCLYCGETHLLPKGGWFGFAPGCDACAYEFTREVGYFSGAFQMILLTIISLTALLLALALLFLLPDLGAISIVMIVSAVLFAQLFLLIPWAMALWMWIDHSLHPLEEKGR